MIFKCLTCKDGIDYTNEKVVEHIGHDLQEQVIATKTFQCKKCSWEGDEWRTHYDEFRHDKYSITYTATGLEEYLLQTSVIEQEDKGVVL